MFKSKLRPIIIPQSEHARLAEMLAALWGNEEFDRPAIDPVSFIAGVGLHDRGYGYLDNLPLLETPPAEWLAVTRRSFYMPCSDPVADLIVKFHLRRLTSYTDSPGHNALLAEMEGVIQTQIRQHGLDREQFERIDRITRLCDNIAFDFCFERPASDRIMVFPRNDSNEAIPVHYSIKSGEVTIEPWPLSLESYSNYLVGYKLPDYPAVLDPVVIPIRLSKGG